MSNSQNKKNEQQNNLCTTLTEQLKKGELEQGYYYMQIPTGDIRIITECMKVDCKGFSILSKVPSYEEWKAAYECQLMESELVLTLKELLKECSPYVVRSATSRMIKNSVGHKKDMNLLTKIDNAIGEKK